MKSLLKEYRDKVNKRDKTAKLKHIDACLLPESQYEKSAGFEEVTLPNNPAAGLSLDEISLKTQFLGHDLASPLMIAPMTGGTKLSLILNERWARAAQKYSLVMGVGSQRVALEDALAQKSFQIRKFAPDAFIFANLGAVQLTLGMTPEHAYKAVEMIEANALFLHLNPLQEACQPRGNTNFSGVLKAITAVVEYLSRSSIPVFVREVGFGLSKTAIKELVNTGVAGIDCAGAGGTSWAKVESLCSENDDLRRLGQTFGEWGIKTLDSIQNVRSINATIPLIATGGIRTGIDVAKSLALGANLAAMAQPMLKAAMLGDEELHGFIESILHELRVAMFASGVGSIEELRDLIQTSQFSTKKS